MKHIIITLLLAVCFAGSAVGQPEVRTVANLDFRSWDVYQTTDQGFAVCGSSDNTMKIARLDTAFQTTWIRDYRDGHLFSIVENDDGGFLAGGGSGDLHTDAWVWMDGGTFDALRTDEEGRQLWRRSYGNGQCMSVIELKSGNYVLVGFQFCGDSRIVLTEPNGRAIWNRTYHWAEEDGNGAWLYGCREAEGGIVASGLTWFPDGNRATWWLKVGFEGEIVWSDTGRSSEGNAACMGQSLVSTPDGGFLIGNQDQTMIDAHGPDNLSVIKINNRGEFQWGRMYEDTGGLASSVSLALCGNDGFVIVGELLNRDVGGVMARINNDGSQRWWRRFPLSAYGVIYTANHSILISGYDTYGGHGGHGGHGGALVEIEPEVPGPTIGFRQPDSSTVYALPGDSINFRIRATNQWGNEVNYAWFYNDSLIARDSSAIVTFLELGQFNVIARAYSDGDSAQVVWQVDVTEFYIAAYSPVNRNLSVRDMGSVDFSIDRVRAIGGNQDIEYQWTLMNISEGDRNVVSEDSCVTIQFRGDEHYNVEGLIQRGDQFDIVEWDVRLRAGILDVGSASVESDLGRITRVPIVLFNDEQDSLHWRVEAKTRGEAGSELGTMRHSVSVGEILDDDRIEGAIFDGDSYYCAGSNGDNPNAIYQLNRQGELVGSFEQPGHSLYGMKDLEWDGELIWGSGEDSVYAINRNGEGVQRWRGPFNPNNSIAYDTEEEILWISATTSNLVAYDRDGNNLGRSLDRQGLRVYGLGWYGDDPDSSFLYALNIPGNDSAQINKFNPLTGEMHLVHSFPLDSATGFNGAFICRNFDRYQGWVMLTVANIPMASGGDALRVYQLEPNREWLTVHPDCGEIPPGESAEVEIRVRTAGWDGSWAFEVGEYEGEIVFEHNGQGGRDVLPVHLRVVEPNEVAPDGEGRPSSFELFTAYPNPFNSSTTIMFSVVQVSQPVKLAVYDLQGRLVDELVNGRLSAGHHTAVWDGTDLATGVYLIRLESGGVARIVKGVIVK